MEDLLAADPDALQVTWKTHPRSRQPQLPPPVQDTGQEARFSRDFTENTIRTALLVGGYS